MSTAEAFLRIYPPLHVLMHDGFYIWELVWNEAGRISVRKGEPRPTKKELLAKLEKAKADGADLSGLSVDDFIDGHSLKGWKRYVLSKSGDFATALKDTEVQAIGAPFYDDLSQGYALLKRARTDNEIVSAEELIEKGLYGPDGLYEFYNRTAKACLGQWGAWFFERYVEETSPGLGFPKLTYLRSLGLDNFKGKRPDWIPQLAHDDFVDSDTVVAEEATFSIRWGDRDPCSLGNSKQFRLFKVLLDSLGQYISFSDIVERMGDDAQDVDALLVVKRRLVVSLTDAHYSRIAESICSEPGHYGLFL